MTLRTRNNILSAQKKNPFGEEIRSYSRRDKLPGGLNYKYKFTGKESVLDYFGPDYLTSKYGPTYGNKELLKITSERRNNTERNLLLWGK